MDNTQDNLLKAFAGESQANRRYLFFAKIADKEGYPQIARLFRAAAEAETVHAYAHLEAIGNIGSTRENLGIASKGEHYEFTEMYPIFIEQAKSENNKKAELSFLRANDVEKIHHELYEEALNTFKEGQELKDKPYFVCQVCGNTVIGEAPEKCPICGRPRSMFKRVD
jgi:rubrerythrin